jgi:hypothetical protein
MKIKKSYLVFLSLLIIGCGSDKVERLTGTWQLVGENCTQAGICKKKAVKRLWIFSSQSEDGSKIIFSTQTEKPYIFKGREIFVSAAEIVPLDILN